MEMTTERVWFDAEDEISLLNAITLAEAHVAESGEVKQKLNVVLNVFCASRPITYKAETRVPKPKLSTSQEHFRKLAKNSGASNPSNVAASDISQHYGEL